ncbi:hypothetical protein HPB48_010587 [Haemaphysalis longicornis]|uniref:EGF-like domain-containing protein n=1 Tax=Haemaphysalis longicornis TaxID=44386 RepID=A0A9J6H424_HAELO|nr:hypothetical protein HPB48_010587 [Haemaphysalis longicornis]
MCAPPGLVSHDTSVSLQSFVACKSSYWLPLCPSACTPQPAPDQNECQEDAHDCEHTCINLWGSFRCACHTGFRLAEDGRSCVGEHIRPTDYSLE